MCNITKQHYDTCLLDLQVFFLYAFSLGAVLHEGWLAGGYGGLVGEDLAVLGVDQDHLLGAHAGVLPGQLGRVVGPDDGEVGAGVDQAEVDPPGLGHPLEDADEPVQGLFLCTFLIIIWQLLHTSTMSQTITDIHGSSQIFRVSELVSF